MQPLVGYDLFSTHTHTVLWNMTQWVKLARLSHTNTVTHSLGKEMVPAGCWCCLDTTHLQSIRTPKQWIFSLTPTWPKMESIKTVGIEVVSDAVAPPPLPSSRVGSVAFSVGPAHPQMGGLAGHEVVHLVDHQLVVPLLILSWALAHAEEDVRPHAGNDTNHEIRKHPTISDIHIFRPFFLLVANSKCEYICNISRDMIAVSLAVMQADTTRCSSCPDKVSGEAALCAAALPSFPYGENSQGDNSYKTEPWPDLLCTATLLPTCRWGCKMNPLKPCDFKAWCSKEMVRDRLSNLWTSLTSWVCSSRSLLGSKWSQIRFWLVRTATPLHTHSEQSTSRI